MAEAGSFAAYHQEPERTKMLANAMAEHLPDDQESRLCCLHDTKEFPAFFNKYQNYRIIGYSDPSSAGTPPMTEDQFYEACPLALFLNKFFMLPAKSPSEESLRRDYVGPDFRNTRIAIVKAITHAFLERQTGRIDFEKPLQDRIVLKIPSKHPLETPGDFDTLVIEASDQTLAIFNILKGNQPVTWGRLKDAYRQQGSYHIPWIADTESAIADILKGITPRVGIDVTFRALNSDQVFRPVPARYVRYLNGSTDMIVSIIPARPRKVPVVGISSSLLLLGLFYAARFRHEFLSHGLPLLAPDIMKEKLDAECQNLKRSIEIVENEAAEFGITNPDLLIQAVGEPYVGTIKGFFNVWLDSRQAIFNTIEARLREDRQSPSDDDTKATIRHAFDKLKPLNKEFVILMCKRLAEETNAG
jgi:hypothetical protein